MAYKYLPVQTISAFKNVKMKLNKFNLIVKKHFLIVVAKHSVPPSVETHSDNFCVHVLIICHQGANVIKLFTAVNYDFSK